MKNVYFKWIKEVATGHAEWEKYNIYNNGEPIATVTTSSDSTYIPLEFIEPMEEKTYKAMVFSLFSVLKK